jgi:hypothetical protein
MKDPQQWKHNHRGESGQHRHAGARAEDEAEYGTGRRPKH